MPAVFGSVKSASIHLQQKDYLIFFIKFWRIFRKKKDLLQCTLSLEYPKNGRNVNSLSSENLFFTFYFVLLIFFVLFLA